MQERARIIWDGEDGLEKEKQRRLELREKKKEKNYAKQLKGVLFYVVFAFIRFQ